jgi:hypothetical protein
MTKFRVIPIRCGVVMKKHYADTPKGAKAIVMKLFDKYLTTRTGLDAVSVEARGLAHASENWELVATYSKLNGVMVAHPRPARARRSVSAVLARIEELSQEIRSAEALADFDWATRDSAPVTN